MKKIVVGNWKMNGGLDETVRRITTLKTHLVGLSFTEVVLVPPFTSLHAAAVALQDSEFFLGAQNIHWEKSGAYTGEVSAVFVKEIGCQHVLAGHSERRQYFHESSAETGKKMRAALEQDLCPILCIGETRAQRDVGEREVVLEEQLALGLEGVSSQMMQNVWIAYEPVWAIGTGLVPEPDEIGEVHAKIRAFLSRHFDEATAKERPLLYGGSVKAQNTAGLLGIPQVDGLLVGGASLDVTEFVQIVRIAEEMGHGINT